MTQEKIEQLLTDNMKKIDAEQVETIREHLANVDDATGEAAFANLKSPTGIFWIAFFLGCLGIDRFVLGQTGLGVAKILTCGGCYVWAIIDWFTAAGRARKYNTEKILEQI